MSAQPQLRRSDHALAACGWALAATLAAALTASSQLDARGPATRATVMVLYVGADDCAPCRVWRREHRERFAASAEFARLTYREVTAAHLFDLLDETQWPLELERYRGSFGRAAGVPLWLVIKDDGVVLTARGLRQWEEAVLPAVRSLLR
jgi:hypothetical protein